MNKFSCYTGRTGNVLSEYLQKLWLIILMMTVPFALQANLVINKTVEASFSSKNYGEVLWNTIGLKSNSFSSKTTLVGGDFSLDFVASYPFSYDHTEGGGIYGQRVIGTQVVESLEGGDFTCGDIVTFFTKITVAADAVGSQTIELDYEFLAHSTGQPGVALWEPVSVYLNDVGPTPDYSGVEDPGYTGNHNEAIENDPFTLDGDLFVKPTKTLGTVEISGLEAGESVILRVDVVIHCDPGSSPTGNLQAAIKSGRVLNFTGRDGIISVGNQTIPFKNVNLIVFPTCDITPADPVCEGATTSYTASSDVADATYLWSITGNGSIVGAAMDGTKTVVATGGATSTSVDVLAGSSGSYTISVAISKSGYGTQNCSETITVNPAVTTEAGLSGEVCQGRQVIDLTRGGPSVGGGATDGTWSIVSPSPSTEVVLTDNSLESGKLGIAATFTGVITLQLTSDDPEGPCEATTDTRTITVYPAATAEAGASGFLCQSPDRQFIDLTRGGPSVGGGATDGTWTIESVVPSGPVALTDATLAGGTLGIGANYVGVITLKLTSDDPEGPCPAATDTRTITINPAATAEAGLSGFLCQSPERQTVDLTRGGPSVGGGATDGTWTIESIVPAGPAALTDATLANGTLVIGAEYVGVITLKLTSDDPEGPCPAASDTRTITVNPAATAEAGLSGEVCQGRQVIDLTRGGPSVGGGATEGTWSIVSPSPSTEVVLIDSDLASGQLGIAGTFTGDIVLMLTSNDPEGPCPAATDTRTITVNPNPTVNVSASTSFCVGTTPTVTITAAPSGGLAPYSYAWTVPAGADPIGDVASFDATVAGTYSVVVTDSRGCQATGNVVPTFVPCRPFEGCTLGYWKNHPDSWCDEYDPDDMYWDVFGLPNTSPYNITLMEALNAKGGGVNNMLRQSVAALLNACHDYVNYEIADPEDVIRLVHRAINAGAEGALGTYLDGLNNAGCSIDAHNNPITMSISSDIQGIGEAGAGDLKAYPTPFSDKATIEFTTTVDESYSVRLYDMKGALVKELKSGEAKAGVVNQVEVDGRGLPEGLYLGRVVSDSGSQTVKLLLKR